MFGRRRTAPAQRVYPQARDGDARPLYQGDESDGDAALSASLHRRTLGTLCRCGHTRREHTGLQIESNGRCLGCDCRRFASVEDIPDEREEILHRIDAAIAHVGRLHSLVERQLGRVPVDGNGVHGASDESPRAGRGS